MPNDILRRCEEEGCAYSQEVSNLTFSVCDTCYLLIHPNELLKKTQIYTTWSNKIMKTPRVDANGFHHQIGTLVNIIQNYAQLRLENDTLTNKLDLCKYYQVFLKLEKLFTRMHDNDIRSLCKLLASLSTVDAVMLNIVLDALDPTIPK